MSSKSLEQELSKTIDEEHQGLYQELYSLIVQGLVAQDEGDVIGRLGFITRVGHLIPQQLILLYPGRVVYNSMGLEQISSEDLTPLVTKLQ